MHRRGLALLLGFLVAVVVAGGGGVRAPWLPVTEPTTPAVVRSTVVDTAFTTQGRSRME